jgi:hypothetical protein
MPNAALVNWDCLRSIPNVYNCESEFFGPIFQLIDDGWGFPYNHRYLIYIEGDRSTVPDDPETTANEKNTCGVSIGQFATVFESACGMTVDGYTGDPALAGQSANTEMVALHEIFHSLGAVPTCAPHDNGNSSHASDSDLDLMWPDLGHFPKQIDFNHDDYFGHSNPSCLDIQDSKFMSNVPG